MTTNKQTDFTKAPREYVESILVALNKIDNGSTAETNYLLEKLERLTQWALMYRKYMHVVEGVQ